MMDDDAIGFRVTNPSSCWSETRYRHLGTGRLSDLLVTRQTSDLSTATLILQPVSIMTASMVVRFPFESMYACNSVSRSLPRGSLVHCGGLES